MGNIFSAQEVSLDESILSEEAARLNDFPLGLILCSFYLKLIKSDKMYFCKDLIHITLAEGSVYMEMRKYGGIHLKRLIFPRRMKIVSFLIYSYLQGHVLLPLPPPLPQLHLASKMF